MTFDPHPGCLEPIDADWESARSVAGNMALSGRTLTPDQLERLAYQAAEMRGAAEPLKDTFPRTE